MRQGDAGTGCLPDLVELGMLVKLAANRSQATCSKTSRDSVRT